jgi:hypothetical protein
MPPRVRIEGFDDTEPSPPAVALAPGGPDASPGRLRSTSVTVQGSSDGKERGEDDEQEEMDPDTCAICLADIWNKVRERRRARQWTLFSSVDRQRPCALAAALSRLVMNHSQSPCHHNLFCFACLHTWCEMSRRVSSSAPLAISLTVGSVHCAMRMSHRLLGDWSHPRQANRLHHDARPVRAAH